MLENDFYRGKKVLVAGGTGTIGIPVIKRLLQWDAEVTVVSMDTEEYARSVLGDEIVFHKMDLMKLENCLSATKDQEYVFNFVGIKGSTGIGETKVASYLVPMLWFQTNLMEAAFRNKAERFMFVSSICGYPYSLEPKKEDTMWDGLPKQNDKIPGLAKRIGEVQAEAYLKEYGWDAVRIVRPSNVYGPYDDFDPATAQVIPSLIRRCLDGENPIKVWGDGSVVRDFIFSEDVADWMLRVLESGPCCEPLNLGCGTGISIRQLAETVVECIDPDITIEWDTSKPSGDPVRILSMQKTTEVIGQLPAVSLKDGLLKTIEWYSENKQILDQKERRYYGKQRA